MTLEQLKQAYELGATHYRDVDLYKVGRKYVYCQGDDLDWVKVSDSHDDINYWCSYELKRIDYSPLNGD